MMASVGWSVQLAGWGDLPPIIPTLALGTLTAFFVVMVRFPWYLMTIYGAGVGFFVVLWQGSMQASGDNPYARTVDSYARIEAWLTAAQTGGISTDTVPFAMMFMTASWIVGFGVTSLTYRLRSPWLPTVLLSLLILTNLSYRHGEYEYTYFLFLVGGIALFAHLTAVKRLERWRAQNIEFSDRLSWIAVQDGLLFALPIVFLSALLPIWEPRSETIHETWDVFRAPFVALQDPASRLLAGVDGPAGGDKFAIPSQTMAFSGPLELTDEPLMWVRSKYMTPHAGRVYQTYTSQGWLTDSATKVEAEPRTALNLAPTESARERISQVYLPLLDTKVVLPAGGVFSVDRESLVQILDPLVWRVPLSGSVTRLAELPPDLRDLAFTVRYALNDLVPTQSFAPTNLGVQQLASEELVNQVLAEISQATITDESRIITRAIVDEDDEERKFETIIVPFKPQSEIFDFDQLSIGLIIDDENRVVSHLEFEREVPIEQVGVELLDDVGENDSYSTQTFVSLATHEQLNEAGTDYPKSITDRYLQLPNSVPDEVRGLAQSIISDAGAETPLEKTEAIKAFLQSQEYSLEISGPEFGVDGIFYFLFQTQDEPCSSKDPECDVSKIKGYSQYFGSAASVLLRSVGVPSRFVAGWAPGDYVSEAGMYLVRDEDRHGWAQVYFPEYGWIDYEFTPGSVDLVRGLLTPEANTDIFAAGAVGSAEEDPDFLQDLSDLERLAREARARNDGEADDEILSVDEPTLSIPWQPFAIMGGVVGLGIIVYGAWLFSVRGLSQRQKSYAKLERLTLLVGMRRRQNETPTEFASRVALWVPRVEDELLSVAIEYQREVYSARSDTEEDDEIAKTLNRCWRTIAWHLIKLRLRNPFKLPQAASGKGVTS